MSEYSEFPQEFLRRTIENVKSYKEQFEVTNLINSCLGLIIIPNDHLIDTLPNYTFDNNDKRFGIRRANIYYEQKQNFNLKNIVRHIRNGLSHGLIEQRTQQNKIVGLRIYDRRDKKSPENFSIELTVEEFKEFALSLAKYFLKDV